MRRLLLPLLALVAVLFAPLARPIHEAIESAHHSAAALHHEHDTAPEAPAHDSSHCATCAMIGSVKQLAAASACIFSLSHERAVAFILPPYLAPTTAEPALDIAVPRGPPLSA